MEVLAAVGFELHEFGLCFGLLFRVKLGLSKVTGLLLINLEFKGQIPVLFDFF